MESMWYDHKNEAERAPGRKLAEFTRSLHYMFLGYLPLPWTGTLFSAHNLAFKTRSKKPMDATIVTCFIKMALQCIRQIGVMDGKPRGQVLRSCQNLQFLATVILCRHKKFQIFAAFHVNFPMNGLCPATSRLWKLQMENEWPGPFMGTQRKPERS